MNKKVKEMVKAMKKHGWFHPQTSTHALGGGEWSLEIHGPNGVFVCEYVGENGTHNPADDLWGEFRADWSEAEAIAEQRRYYVPLGEGPEIEAKAAKGKRRSGNPRRR